jgi:AraC-like DNA-binding protein
VSVDPSALGALGFLALERLLRAFKRWTGETPADFRVRSRGARK